MHSAVNSQCPGKLWGVGKYMVSMRVRLANDAGIVPEMLFPLSDLEDIRDG